MIITDVYNHFMIRPQPQEISLSSQSQMFTRCLGLLQSPNCSGWWRSRSAERVPPAPGGWWPFAQEMKHLWDPERPWRWTIFEALCQTLPGRWNISETLSQTLLVNPKLCSDIIGEKTLLRQKGKGSDHCLLGPLFKLKQVHTFL